MLTKLCRKKAKPRQVRKTTLPRLSVVVYLCCDGNVGPRIQCPCKNVQTVLMWCVVCGVCSCGVGCVCSCGVGCVCSCGVWCVLMWCVVCGVCSCGVWCVLVWCVVCAHVVCDVCSCGVWCVLMWCVVAALLLVRVVHGALVLPSLSSSSCSTIFWSMVP